jgi:hypothetical protein
MPNEQIENTRTIYTQLCESYRAIDDFRTKLLAALPLASGTGIFLLIGKPEERIPAGSLMPIGVFGFLAALGLYIFEIYAIRKCTHLIVLGAFLEKQLSIEGQFQNRPSGLEHFPLLPKGIAPLTSEPFASGIIYPAVLAAWAFVGLYKPNACSATGLVVGTALFVAGFLISLGYSRWLQEKDAPRKTSQLTDTAGLTLLACRMGEAEKSGKTEFFEALLADKLTFRRASGAIVGKETFLTGLRNPANTYETLEPEDIAVRVYEDIAVVTLLVQAKGMREGEAFDGVFRNILIFLHEPDKAPQWQLHSWFNVRVPSVAALS